MPKKTPKKSLKKSSKRALKKPIGGSAKQKLERLALSLSYVMLTLIVAFTISWVLLAKYDFMYGVWHDHGGIAEGIETFGPKNRYKAGFAETSKAERVRLFSAINESVHRGGEGLTEIRYRSETYPQPQRLLRTPEVIHLQDVANLIDILFWVAFTASALWLGVSSYLLLGARELPSPKQQGLALLVFLVPAVSLILIIGPTEVFNQLHIWVFPAGHEWFFYYQDSLMSTMMLAPVLFGWIALALLVVALLMFAALQVGLYGIAVRLKALQG